MSGRSRRRKAAHHPARHPPGTTPAQRAGWILLTALAAAGQGRERAARAVIDTEREPDIRNALAGLVFALADAGLAGQAEDQLRGVTSGAVKSIGEGAHQRPHHCLSLP